MSFVLSSWLQFIYGDRTETTNPLGNKFHLQHLVYSPNIKNDRQTLLPIHVKNCKERPNIIDSPSSSEPMSPSNNPTTSTNLKPKTVNFSKKPVQEISCEDIVVIQPHTQRGSSDNLFMNETTFPIRNDFTSNRFHFFVNIFC